MRQRPGYLNGVSAFGHSKLTSFAGFVPRRLNGLRGYGLGQSNSRRLLPTGDGNYAEGDGAGNWIGPKIPGNFPAHLPPPDLLGPGYVCKPDGMGGIVCDPTRSSAPSTTAISVSVTNNDDEADWANWASRRKRRSRSNAASGAAPTASGQVPITTTHSSGINVSAPSAQTIPLPDAYFMRADGAVASRLSKIPEGWNEEAYLAKNPDVAKAVDKGIMPSGLWHYMTYGKNEGRTLAGWKRPGFLAGISSMWKRR